MKKIKKLYDLIELKEKTCKLSDVYKLLKARPFSNECIYEADLYEAYCLRIIETLED
jgi:hypothetical protein